MLPLLDFFFCFAQLSSLAKTDEILMLSTFSFSNRCIVNNLRCHACLNCLFVGTRLDLLLHV